MLMNSSIFSIKCYNEDMKKKTPQYRTLGMITFEGQPIEMQATKKGELRFLENKKEIKNDQKIEKILAYLKEANQ